MTSTIVGRSSSWPTRALSADERRQRSACLVVPTLFDERDERVVAVAAVAGQLVARQAAQPRTHVVDDQLRRLDARHVSKRQLALNALANQNACEAAPRTRQQRAARRVPHQRNRRRSRR